MSSVPTLVPLALPTVMVVESVLAPPVIVVDAVELALVSDPNPHRGRAPALQIEGRLRRPGSPQCHVARNSERAIDPEHAAR
jgi:hypothetical protein